MQIDTDALPNDLVVLQQMLRDLYAENDKLRLLIDRLTRHISVLASTYVVEIRLAQRCGEAV